MQCIDIIIAFHLAKSNVYNVIVLVLFNCKSMNLTSIWSSIQFYDISWSMINPKFYLLNINKNAAVIIIKLYSLILRSKGDYN